VAWWFLLAHPYLRKPACLPARPPACPQVRNRTPKEIKAGMPLSEAREKERDYFRTHPQLQVTLPPSCSQLP
jgi:hypothetical protein